MNNIDYDRNAFKPLKGNIISLDFSNCNIDGIHKVLKENFGLPDYYGENWGALWDCLDGLFYNQGNYTVKIYGYNSLCAELRDYCKTMFEIFDHVHNKAPNVKIEIVS